MKNKLADFNLLYTLLLPIVQYATLCHYRHIAVHGRDNLPTDGRYILAPCHQNGLMDPLIVLRVCHRPVVFMARADIFNGNMVRRLLTWLRISPVYRLRDGRGSLNGNEELFEQASQGLLSGVPLCLMAEGTHNNRHQLLPFGKGMFRIAGSTQQKLGDEPLHIVPVAIDYEHYWQPYTSVAVEIGKPIDVRQYMAEYAANEPQALNHMRDDLSLSLKGLMHNVGCNEHYDDEYAYCHLQTNDTIKQQHLPHGVWGRFAARRYVSQKLSTLTAEEREAHYAEGKAFADNCERFKVPLWYASRQQSGHLKCVMFDVLMLAVVAIAVVVYWDMMMLWVVSNPIVYLPTHLIIYPRVDDTQFRSSYNHGVRFALTLLWCIGIFVYGCFAHSVWWGIGMVLMGATSAWLTPKVFVLLRNLRYHLTYRSKTSFNRFAHTGQKGA